MELFSISEWKHKTFSSDIMFVVWIRSIRFILNVQIKKKNQSIRRIILSFFWDYIDQSTSIFRHSYNSIEFEDPCTFLIIPTYLHLRVNAGLNIPIVYDHVNHVHAMQPLPSFFDYFNHMYYTNAACKPFFHSYSLLFFSTKLRLRWNIVSYTCVQISISLSFFLILW